MNRPFPRMILAALRGGAGKTAITVALTVALQRQGRRVIPFKKGPDYIDAAWLARAASSPCFNLDTYLIGRDQVVRSFSRHTSDDALALIEGNRGLYDGMNLAGVHSTAELAKLLRAPVILIVDCDKVTRTMAAMVLGCQNLDPEVNIQGVILNRVGGTRHADMLRNSIENICKLPVYGIVPRVHDFMVRERHLGLVPPQEHDRVREVLNKAGDIAENYLDLAGLTEVAQNTPDWPETADTPENQHAASDLVTIGIIRDSAFQFYYEENIEALTKAGARVVEISSIDDEALPVLDGLYIGGGFPETRAEFLVKNTSFRRSLLAAIEQGLPVYAECGGLIYLGESLTIGDSSYPMVGALPISFRMEKRPQGHGYTMLEVEHINPFFSPGTVIKGHEFHYCRVLSDIGDDNRLVCRVRRGAGINGIQDGLVKKNILACFTHIHALGTPEWAPGMINRARWYRKTRN